MQVSGNIYKIYFRPLAHCSLKKLSTAFFFLFFFTDLRCNTFFRMCLLYTQVRKQALHILLVKNLRSRSVFCASTCKCTHMSINVNESSLGIYRACKCAKTDSYVHNFAQIRAKQMPDFTSKKADAQTSISCARGLKMLS